ncbi:(2Fe-2S)-binding protein [Paenibacillus sp. SYP-B4298]|uniref:(2Fe-2S)-binding protein n=1 Tax=Paenibacillus sp. SYP-B4298 TaxID=2996034 RepID=UPI0022DE5B2F|nr:(2Fe-2S)-binding protein [Paenibacillus sp. SYP-B4298]
MNEGMDWMLIEQNLNISPTGAAEPLAELPAAMLLDHEQARTMLEQAGAAVRADGLVLPASFAGLSVYYLFAASIIMMAQSNRLPDLSMDNLTLQLERYGDDHAHLRYLVHRPSGQELPEEPEAMEAFVEQEVTRYIQEVMVPLVEGIAEAAGVKSAMIWNQFSGQYTYLNKLFFMQVQDVQAQARFERIYDLILNRVSPEVFGRRRHPFVHKPRYIDNPANSEEKWMIRSSCCMYYARENGRKCFTCPKMTPSELEERKQELLASAK